MRTNPFRTCLAASATGLLALATVLPARADYSSTVIGLNPIAYYRLNETTPVPADTATNRGTLGAPGLGNYSGSVTHPVTGALVGSSDTAASFSGGKVVVPYNASVNPSGPFTVEAWINPSDTSTTPPIANRVIAASMINGENSGNTADRTGWIFRQNGDALTFLIGGAGGYTTTATSGSALTAGVWQHVAVVFDSATTNITILVNGAQVLNTTGTAALPPNYAAPLIVGDRGYGGWTFSGAIDEVALYTNALTTAEVLAHYNNGTSPSPSPSYDALVLGQNPIVYYRLDDPTFNFTAVPAPNLGSLGAAADGAYEIGAVTGVPGPSFAGFGAGNTAMSISSIAGDMVIPPLAVNTANFTITCWFKRTGAHLAGQALVFNRGTTPATGLGFGYDGSPGVDELNVHWNEGPSSWLTGLTPLNDVWYFGAAVYTPTNVTVYLDNTASSFTVALTAHDFSQASTYIGLDDAPYPRFTGSIDEVALFDRSLSPAEVQSLFSASEMPAQVLGVTRTPADPLYEGDNITMTATSDGAPPFTNQWYKNNSPLSGKTNLTLSILNATIADSGSYEVVVANAYGSSTSAVQTITVQGSAPVIFTQPASVTGFAGGSATFTVVAGGSFPRSYQWTHGTTPISGATAASLTLANIQWTDAGSYTCAITNAYGATNTAAATLTVGGEFVSTVLPEAGSRDRHVALGSDGTNLFFTLGNAANAAFYRKSGASWTALAPIPLPATVDDSSGVGDMNYFGGALWTLARSPDNTGARCVYRYDLSLDAWSTGANLPGDGPNAAIAVLGTDNILGGWIGYYPVLQITDWQAGTDVTVGNLPGAAAHPWDACIGPDNVYYIKHYNIQTNNGVLASINKTGTPSITIIDGMPFNPGMGCAVEYMPGSLFSNGHALLYVLRGGVGGNDDGNDWTAATSVNQLAIYDLVTQTWSLETLPFAVDQGSEMCLVNQTLYVLAANSDPQPLKVLYLGPPVPPTVAQQPVSQTIYLGQPVTFSVSISGGGPYTYQWRQAGADLTGANGSSLTVNNAWYTNGNYDVVVVSPAGSITSQVATLTVQSLPTYANLTNGLVLHLTFDTDATADTSGRTNNAVAGGMPILVSGKLGQAVQLQSDGTNNSYLSVYDPNSDFQFDATDSFSIAFWLKYTNAFNDLPIIGNAGNSTWNPGFVLTEHGGQLEWTLTTVFGSGQVIADPVGGTANLNDGAWHQLTVVYDRSAGVARSFADGALIDTRSITAIGDLASGNVLTIGQDPTDVYAVNGTMVLDDIGIWRRALTRLEAEAISIVGQNNGRSFDSLVRGSLTLQQSGANLQLIWEAGTLQWTEDLKGTWTDVPGAGPSFYQLTPDSYAKKFFRVKIQ